MTVRITYHGHVKPEDAVKAVGFLQPPMAILMHYDTFGVITRRFMREVRTIRRSSIVAFKELHCRRGMETRSWWYRS